MTFEEIKKALEANKDLKKQVAVWSSSTEEGKELLTNHAKAEVEKAVKEATAQLYTNIDDDLFEVLGKRKAANQKTYDFVKGLANELKELRGKADKLNDNDKIKELEAKIKQMESDGSVNEHWKKIYDEASAKWENEKKEMGEKIAAKEKEYIISQIEADLQKGLASLKLRDDIPQQAVDALVEAQKQKILKSAKIIEGKVVYHKEDGTPLLNQEFKPITPKEIWEDVLGGIVTTNKDQSGGNANTTVKEGKVIEKGQGDNATIKLVLDEDSFSTKQEFNEKAELALRKQGIGLGDKRFKQAILEAYERYGVDKLDLQ